jgi:hypothetical protein
MRCQRNGHRSGGHNSRLRYDEIYLSLDPFLLPLLHAL